MLPLVVAAGALLGLAVGSFLNVVVHRVPEGRSVVSPGSRCASCGTEIAARDNIPVVSWVLLRGRCRHCGAAISPRYPAIEMLTGMAFVAASLRLGEDAALPAYWAWSAGLLALSAVDLERFILPNKILYPTLGLAALGLAVAAALRRDAGDLDGGLVGAAVGGAVGFAVIFVIWFVSPRGMGYGDVRLSGLNGVLLGWLGVGHVAVGLFLGFLSASVVGVTLLVARRKGRKDPIPFGPFLALGAFAAFLWGRPILDWYGVGG